MCIVLSCASTNSQQFFCDRVSYLIHLKHTLLVRWARFASRPSVVAKLNDSFQELMRSAGLAGDTLQSSPLPSLHPSPPILHGPLSLPLPFLIPSIILHSLINTEYDDAVSRARRLSVARDCLLATKPPPLSTVQREDVLIYLRWLVGHLHSTKRLSAAVSVRLLLSCDVCGRVGGWVGG